MDRTCIVVKFPIIVSSDVHNCCTLANNAMGDYMTELVKTSSDETGS